MKNWMFFLALILSFKVDSQNLSKDKIIRLSNDNLIESVTKLNEFLKIPNNGRYAVDRNANVDYCLKVFNDLEFTTTVEMSDSIPHVFAEKIYDSNYKTILFYLQIDGQPVDTLAWDQPNPYIPVFKKMENALWKTLDDDELKKPIDHNLRIFARSASDSKGPAMAFITALKILKENKIEPNFNIKVIMDFQEELGSPTLPALVKAKRKLFEAEMMLIMDGTRHLSNLPTLTFGARGIATVTLKVFGAKKDLHSGQYGNFAPNPVFKLSRLLAEMKDEHGRILIPDFYGGIELSEDDKIEIDNIPETLVDIKSSLGIAKIDSVGTSYSEALQYPSLNVRGLRAGWTGENVRTIIPSVAIAEIDMRLVPETPAERQIKLLKDFIISRNFHVVDSIPNEEERAKYANLIAFDYNIGSKPFRTEINSEIGKWLSRSMAHIFGEHYVKMRTTGGSQPIAPFINTLNIPAVSVRIPNPDNSIHAPNENLRVGNYLEGIQICLSILSQEL